MADNGIEDEDVKRDILHFVRKLFQASTDIGKLTMKDIRGAYLKETDRSKLTDTEKTCFKPVVETLFLEFQSEEEEPKEDLELEREKEVDSGEKLLTCSDSENEKVPSEMSAADGRSPGHESEDAGEVFGRRVSGSLSDSERSGLGPKVTKRKRVLSSSESCSESEGDFKEDEQEVTQSFRSKNFKKELRGTEIAKVLDGGDSEEESPSNLESKRTTDAKKRERSSTSDESVADKKPKKKKQPKKPTKKSSGDENEPPKKKNKVEESKNLKLLKSCCRAAGLFVHYNKVFVDCSSDEQKEKSLLGLLKDSGLRGKPTLEACKRLKLRREEKKALEDLDTANILSTTGRSHRHAAGRNQIYPHAEDKKIQSTPLCDVKKTYSRLKGIVDSEESSSD